MPEPIHDKWVYGQRTNITKAATDKREHAGLWFDKYISRQQKKDIPLGKGELSPYKALVDTAADIPEPQMYSQFFKRWQQQLETMRVAIDGCDYKVQYQYASAQGRIAIGLGDESVIETAMTLHHTYGVPYIPGSALKGLASAYAHRFLEDERWRKKGEYHTAMFGTTDSSGYITFFDALYCPGTGRKNKEGTAAQALWPDVITVHHKAYYENQKDKAPADWDNPTPIPFLTATGTYLVALGGPDSWVSLAFNLLGRALAEMGIGAKTNSGYGRMRVLDSASADEQPPSDAGNANVEASTEPGDNHTQQKAAQSSESMYSPNRELKRGQDLWGKVIDRRERKWIILLEESGLKIRATDKNAKGKVDFGVRVRVRIENTQPLEGSIKDVRR